MRFAIELATMAQRDRFVENPVEKVYCFGCYNTFCIFIVCVIP